MQADVAIMRRDASMSVSSPKVTAVALSEEVTAEQLGGWEVHARGTGQIDIVGDPDEQAIAAIAPVVGHPPSPIRQAPALPALGAGRGSYYHLTCASILRLYTHGELAMVMT